MTQPQHSCENAKLPFYWRIIAARHTEKGTNSRMRSMMRFFALVSLLWLMAIPAAAQSTSSSSSSSQQTQQVEAPQEAPPPPVVAPYELSAGYSFRIFTQPTSARIGMNGGYGSFDYKILSRISADAEFSAAFRGQGINGDLSIYSFLVGPQIYPFKHRRKFTPFVHVLLGEGFYRNSYPAYGGFPAAVRTDSSFSWEGGGGLDLTHSPRLAIRVFDIDYAQTKFLGNLSQANYRLSIGIVYRFGQK
ncbi:MAG TPA: hypothetical protein VG322_07770 [Candidatus Acidoferrales bacterium]|nr:hypothetical protein [Candidatus Acidoferrales bacterium]